MGPTSSRTLWKGAISFGLVHIPVGLYSATDSAGMDFNMLDKRTMDPVGYKRINKRTGEAIESENIVKGVQYEKDSYVVLSPEEISAAYPKTTQTIEIEQFVDEDTVPLLYMERPYYVAPINKGAKVYALLREVLRETRKVGVAKVVIQTKQHLAMLMPCGPVLVLNLLRWDDEVRSFKGLTLPAEGTEDAGLTDRELKMGKQLVTEMSGPWEPEQFHDSFREQIMKLVEEKVAAGETSAVTDIAPHEKASGGAQIIDIADLLQRSLSGGKKKADEFRLVPDEPKQLKKAASKNERAPAKTAVKVAKPAVKAVKTAAAPKRRAKG